jgi:cell division septation protein DedD
MTDTRIDDPALEEDRLPWLEAVEEDDEREGPDFAKLIAFVVIGLVAIGLIVGGLFWMNNRDTGSVSGEPEVIAAPVGDYKVKPADPGGMKVDGEGDTAFAASAGADPKSALDVNAVPETPVVRAPVQPVQAPAAPSAAAPAAAKAPEPAPPVVPSAGGATVQLGAFSSEASANTAWKRMSSRFTYLAPLTHGVTTVTSGGKTLYRLRASGPDAASLCGRLRVAGESCVVVN